MLTIFNLNRALLAMLMTFASVAYSDKAPRIFEVSFPYGESFYVMGISHHVEEKDARITLETLEPYLERANWVALERAELISVRDYFQNNRLYPDDFIEVSIELSDLYNSHGYCMYCTEQGVIQYAKDYEMNVVQLDDDVFYKKGDASRVESQFKLYQKYSSRELFYNEARVDFENNFIPKLKLINRHVNGENLMSKKELQEALDTEALMETYRVSELVAAGDGDGAQFIKTYRVSERNRQWAQRLKTLLFNGKGVVLVGYMHLPGKQGLIELLKKEGAEVQEIQMPSPGSSCTNPFRHYWEAQSYRPTPLR